MHVSPDDPGQDQVMMSQSSAIILFDGVCNFCNAGVDFVLNRDPKGYFRFGALQSAEAQTLLQKYDLPQDYLDSIVLIEDGNVFSNSRAILRIARKLTGIWPILYWFRVVPVVVSDSIYGWFARNRYDWFGKLDSCRLPTEEIRSRFI